ncbi:MAG: lysine--tRNA ligase [Planctomycetota bacterium]|nr:lysine--tRNA ligase [Planctomycetota bacterium]
MHLVNDPLIRARREKLDRWRDEHDITGYGHRVDGIVSLREARALFDADAHEAFAASSAAAKDDPGAEIIDRRSRAIVAGRCVQHRAMGRLVFLVLRDDTGDLQISISKAAVDDATFKLARKLDYGDIVVAGGPVGATQRGEICIWADRFELHAKSLTPPPEKWHGLSDPELRYRRRYVDMYANPQTVKTFRLRSRIVSRIRRFMDERDYLEVETPMMQPIAGGAAARPFITHHNALGINIYLRVATELYLKRLLVGGMPRVYEINRNFRNEGVDRSHNPEFTVMEVYQAFGDCWTMLELTESLLHDLAQLVTEAGPDEREAGPDELREEGPGMAAEETESRRDEETESRRDEETKWGGDGSGPVLPFGELDIDWSRPFDRIAYGELFQRTLNFPMTDSDRLIAKAEEIGIENARRLDHWLLVNRVYEQLCEPEIDPARPTFITDYPSVISPLTRPQKNNPDLCDRWELLIAGMEMGTAYTELNDPDVQLAKFTEQLAGADEEEQTFRSLDEDFINALRVGMPPAGGLGLGIDRIVMLLTNAPTIRDVILFPLMKPEGD